MVSFSSSIRIVHADNTVATVAMNPNGTYFDAIQDELNVSDTGSMDILDMSGAFDETNNIGGEYFHDAFDDEQPSLLGGENDVGSFENSSWG